MRLLMSHKFVCPCNVFSLLTEVIKLSLLLYYLQPRGCCSWRAKEIPQILLLFLFPKHFVKEKQMKNGIKDV